MSITDAGSPIGLNSQAVNSIEKIILYLAANNGGKLYAAQLLPYFALSLGSLDSCLQNMVDNSSIVKVDDHGLNCYEFWHLSSERLAQVDLSSKRLTFAEPNRRQAKLEHQIMHAASQLKGRVFAETIAGSTDFTLREIKTTLQQLSLDKYISQEFDEGSGCIYYSFPKIDYNDKNFKANMKFLDSDESQQAFDASAAIFIKFMFICMIIIGLMFFAKVNFRILIVVFMLSLPLSAIMTSLNQKNKKGKT
ncbi:MAG: hypothetical protein HRT88_01875 [Lentisphaeraceae bacterium]|nr:hypothetical protein [Lentisphaeraceae bacterium]